MATGSSHNENNNAIGACICLQVRGWGNLISSIWLDTEKAEHAQDEFGEMVAELLNAEAEKWAKNDHSS